MWVSLCSRHFDLKRNFFWQTEQMYFFPLVNFEIPWVVDGIVWDLEGRRRTGVVRGFFWLRVIGLDVEGLGLSCFFWLRVMGREVEGIGDGWLVFFWLRVWGLVVEGGVSMVLMVPVVVWLLVMGLDVDDSISSIGLGVLA